MRFYLSDLNSLRWYLQRSNHWNWHWFYVLQYWHKVNAGCTLHFGFTHNIKFACLHRVTENVRENMCYERKSVMLSIRYIRNAILVCKMVPVLEMLGRWPLLLKRVFQIAHAIWTSPYGSMQLNGHIPSSQTALPLKKHVYYLMQQL